MGNHDAASARARNGAASDSVTHRNGGAPARPRVTTLSNWPVSRRLFAVIALALLMGLVFGGLEVANAESSATQFGRVLLLAKLVQQDVILTQDLQNERDTTLGLTSGGSTGNLSALHDKTSAETAQFLALAAGVGGSYPANIQASVATLRSQLGTSLTNLQNAVQTQFWDKAQGSAIDALSVNTEYAPLVNSLITLDDELAQGTSDASLAIDVRELNLLSMAKDQSSQQRGLFFNAFTQQLFSNGVLQALISARTAEQSDETAFLSAATPAEQHTFNTTVAGTGVKQVKRVEDFFFIGGQDQEEHPFLSPNINEQSVGFTVAQAPQSWYGSASEKLDEMQTVELGIAQDAVARATSLQHGAGESALLISVSVVVVLLIVLIAALLVARSLAVPLRRLRAAALDIATRQLPDRMRRLSEAPDVGADIPVAPIDVLTSDEIGQVARAFDQVHAEAVRLAGNEAMLRTSLNAMFVNLSRRSQTLIERVARTVDSLEQDEDNPERLYSLFSIDHMVTRMRRNSENLLLLAGHEGARKWSDPVTIADVARAAVSEIEHYNRVVLNIQPGVAVIGSAVSDIVHLLAELIEITDKGIGIPEERLAEVNWRLQSTPAIDVSVSRHMGLFAVARLAERHGVQVRLRPANPQGLSVLVWLPDTVIEHTALPFPGRRAAAGLGGQGGGSTLTRRTPGQTGIAPASANGQSGQERVDWFHHRRRDSAQGIGPADPGPGELTSPRLPMRVPRANTLPGSADGGQPEGTEYAE